MGSKLLTFVLCWCLSTMQLLLPNNVYAGSDSGHGACAVNKEACQQFNKESDRDRINSAEGSGPTQEELEAEISAGIIVDLEDGSGSGANGGKAANDVYHSMSFATLIIAVATTVAGMLFVMSCLNQPSSWVFALTSLYWIIAEVVLMATTKEASERRLTVVTNVSAEAVEKQSAAIKVARDQTQRAADHANSRYIVTSVAAAFFVVAAVVALIEGILHIVSSYDDQCSGAAFIKKAPNLKYAKAINAKLRSLESVNSSWSKKIFKELLPFIGLAEAQASSGSGSGDDSGSEDKNADEKYKSMGYTGAILSILAGVVAATIIAFKTGALTNAFGRCVVMAVYSAFVIAAAVLIKEKKDELDERVKKFDQLLAKLSEALPSQGGPQAGSTGVQNAGTSNTGGAQGQSQELIATDPLLGNCTTGDQHKLPITADLGCKGKGMSIEGNTSLPVNNIIEAPESIVQAMNQSKEFAKNLAEGKGITPAMRQYDSKAYARFNKLKQEFGKKYQDLVLKHKGEKVEPLEQAEKEFRKAVLAQVNSELNKYPKSELNSMMGQLLGVEAANLKNTDGLLKDEDLLKKLTPSSAAKDLKNSTSKIKIDDNANAIGKNSLEEVDSADALQGLNYKENDIANDNGASLFLIITNRYRKTAYPLIFDKNQPAPVKGNHP